MKYYIVVMMILVLVMTIVILVIYTLIKDPERPSGVGVKGVGPFFSFEQT